MHARHIYAPWGVALCVCCLAFWVTNTLAQTLCSCALCSAGGSCGLFQADGYEWRDNEDGEVPSSDFTLRNRWFTTSVDFTNFFPGDPLTLTWGIVNDGTTISGSREGTSPSDLIDMLNRRYGSAGAIEDAPWFRLFEESFDRWSQLSGLTFLYEPNDGGAPIDGTSFPRGQRGVYADLRIGGHSIDGATGSNTLAYNYFPTHGDMVLDTDNESFFANRFNDSVLLRNTLMHEIGHGLGFRHVESSDGQFLMEPSISSRFDGPQFDDILAAHRYYGDALEKNGGNDFFDTATPIGDFEAGEFWRIGNDADGTRVEANETDFVSIDGLSDADFFEFTVSSLVTLDAVLEPRGPRYQEAAQGESQLPFSTSTLANLSLTVFRLDPDGQNIAAVGSSDSPFVGALEIVSDALLEPGYDYFAIVDSTTDEVQMYSLSLLFTEVVIPEPTSALLAVVAGAMGHLRRRSR